MPTLLKTLRMVAALTAGVLVACAPISSNGVIETTRPDPSSVPVTLERSTATPAVIPLSVTPPPFTNILVVDQPKMYTVSVRTYRYAPIEESPNALALDLYYPPEWTPDTPLPVVLFANDFPMNSELGQCGRNCYSYPSWGRLIAANGLIAAIYDGDHPTDMEAVAEFIRANATELGIDADRFGVMGVSADASLAEVFAHHSGHEYVRFLIIYYGYLLTPEGFLRDEFDRMALDTGFYGKELGALERLRSDLPTLLVRCGKDDDLNLRSTDRFADIAAESQMPLTLIRFDTGGHVFDVADPNTADVKEEAINIVEQTLDFMKREAGR